MKFANPRTVWKNYLFDAFELAKKNKKELTVFVHYHANNSVPHDYKINETAAKFDFDFSKEDTVAIDDMTTACSGKINGLIYMFNFADIIQITKLEDLVIQVDKKLLNNSKQHLKFR